MSLLSTIDFTEKRLAHALTIVQTGGFAKAYEQLNLTAHEKALVYHYTHQGSAEIKIPVRESNGLLLEPLGQGLAAVIDKLPPHSGVVYSAELWNEDELRTLQLAAATSNPFHVNKKRWPTFLSASTLKRVANRHLTSYGGEKNCLLQIFSQTGRYIDDLSYHGRHGHDPADPEKEVLFLPNTRFEILDVRFDSATNIAEIELSEL